MASQSRAKEDLDDELPAMLYAVYCVDKLPIEVCVSSVGMEAIANECQLITDFIQETRHENFPIIITSKESHLSDYETSTRLPLDPFESPFLGDDLGAVAEVYNKQIEGLGSQRYGTGNFVILDSQTIKDRTCLIVNVQRNDLQTLRSDFDMALECFMGPEIMSWGFDEQKLAPFFYDNITVIRKLYDRASGGEGGEYTPLFGKGDDQ